MICPVCENEMKKLKPEEESEKPEWTWSFLCRFCNLDVQMSLSGEETWWWFALNPGEANLFSREEFFRIVKLKSFQ